MDEYTLHKPQIARLTDWLLTGDTVKIVVDEGSLAFVTGPFSIVIKHDELKQEGEVKIV